MEFIGAMEINDDEFNKYKTLTNRLKIKREINNIKLEIEKLAVKEEIEEISLSDEKKELQTRLEILTDEGDFSDLSKEYDILMKKEEISNFKRRLKKLEEKKDSISINVFNKLKNEYESGLESSQLFLQNEINNIQKIQDDVKEFLSDYGANEEEIRIRKDLNEIIEDEFENKLQFMKDNKKRAESILELTKLLLEELET